MAKKKISHLREISLAVGVVRNLEKLLIKTSRKRRLTTEQRQKLTKCAAYLKRKRDKAKGETVALPGLLWLRILRFLACLLKSGKHIRDVFDVLIGGQ